MTRSGDYGAGNELVNLTPIHVNRVLQVGEAALGFSCRPGHEGARIETHGWAL